MISGHLLGIPRYLGESSAGAGATGSLHVDNLLLCAGSKERQKRGDHTVRPYEVGFKDPGEVSRTEILHLVVGAVLLYGGVVDEYIQALGSKLALHLLRCFLYAFSIVDRRDDVDDTPIVSTDQIAQGRRWRAAGDGKDLGYLRLWQLGELLGQLKAEALCCSGDEISGHFGSKLQVHQLKIISWDTYHF